VKSRKRPGRLPVSVPEALGAIASTGKGRCWYCDSRLPVAERAIGEGWDVQRIDEQPVASIVLVCPECVQREGRIGRVRATTRARNANGNHTLALEGRRA
jgi:hypothetical protein